MSTERVQAFLDEHLPGGRVVEPDVDTPAVEAAAAALGVEPGQIAETLALRAGERVVLVVARGDARLDDAGFKARFGAEPRMLPGEEAHAVTGHPVGGVSPFGHVEPLEVHCDESLRAFDVVYPAGWSQRSAGPLTPAQCDEVTGGRWVDVTRPPEG